MNLTPDDYRTLEKSYITPVIANAAGLYRVSSLDGRELVGQHGGGDFAGIVFPYLLPGTEHSVLDRLRLDNPAVDAATGKPVRKYLTAPTTRNRLFFPPCDAALLNDTAVPVVITEGEKKALALWRMALETSDGSGKPAFLPLAISGVWNWRGVIGAKTTECGQRVPEKGVLADFDLLIWTGRRVTVLFDSNVASNESVRTARSGLARELTRRQAMVFLSNLPASPGVNGCDDFLHLFGAVKLQEVVSGALPWLWREELVVNDKGQPRAILANAITALRSAPEWSGVLAWDEFAMRVIVMRNPPWGAVEAWSDQEDRRTTEWLQRNGIMVKLTEAGQAIQTAAKECGYHPVRQYLEGLEWDGNARIDDWLVLYAGAQPTDLNRAIAARWLISAVARIFQPGCKADCVLVLEGPQGIGKSTAAETLGGPWYTDDVASLDTKDAPLGTRGKWIIEFSELDAMARSTPSRIKAFVSRATDRFRLPYDRRAGDFPRECVFVGTVNHTAYLRDETGGRRFWPVAVTRVDLAALRRDHDQLWAEAVARFRRGDRWWFDAGETELVAAAESEQSERYDDDPWQATVATWITDRLDTSVGEILKDALHKDIEHWGQQDKSRVAKILKRLGWERYKKRQGSTFEWRYREIGSHVPSSQ